MALKVTKGVKLLSLVLNSLDLGSAKRMIIQSALTLKFEQDTLIPELYFFSLLSYPKIFQSLYPPSSPLFILFS